MPEVAETIRIAEDLHKENLHFLNRVDVTPLGEEWLTRKGFNPRHLTDIRNVGTNYHAFGKQIIIELRQSPHQMKCAVFDVRTPPGLLRISLGMSGRFKLDDCLTETDRRHILFTMHFHTGTVHFIDYRKFFQINFVTHEFLHVFSKLSLLNLDFGLLYVEPEIHIPGPTKKPKIVELLDDGKYSGIGNYLANEGLGRAGLDPRTPFKDYSEKQYAMKTLQGVALESYAAGGHSFNGGFIRPNGETGHFKPQVYGNEKYKRELFRGRPIWFQ